MSEQFEQEAISAYGYDAMNNINESGVLMVTITLNEYRELLAKAERLKSNMENWHLRQEVERLKQRIADIPAGEDTED